MTETAQGCYVPSAEEIAALGLQRQDEHPKFGSHAELKDAALELAGWRPHLLVHDDTAPVPEAALEGVRGRVELSYSDGMNARVVSSGGEASPVRDISTEDLLRAVATVAKWTSRRS